MCGICGIIYFDKERRVEKEWLKRMNDRLIHRGPDDEGFYLKKNIGFGFRRLSIIDLKTGNQPMQNESTGDVIVFNGEIYNYLEKKQKLIKKGIQFKTNSDTEVILKLYEFYGNDFIYHLRGMFALSIWDDKKKILISARDRMGIKPYYYYKDNEKFIFASEIKAILEYPELRISINPDSLNTYLTYGYYPSDLSIYTQVKKLKQASLLLLKTNENQEIKPINYWQLNYNPDYSKNEKYWIENLGNKLTETVKYHMVSDVPFGAFLSGGIDSSSIVSLMASNTSEPVKTFSIGFRENDYNELNYVKSLIKKYKTIHNENIIGPESFNIFERLIDIYDEPFADSSSIPTYFVSNYAAQNVKVVLSGDGGDELFAGYTHYDKISRIANIPFSNNILFKSIAAGAFHLLPEHFRGKHFLHYLAKDKKTLPAYINLFFKNERDEIILPDVMKEIQFQPEDLLIDIIRSNAQKDLISAHQILDIFAVTSESILIKVDRASMANSLEVRVPFLDHELAELCFTIPSDYKLNKYGSKSILKKLMRNYLTDEIIDHRKQGFSLPLNYWFNKELYNYIYARFADKNKVIYNYMNYEYIKKILAIHNYGQRDMSAKIWALLFVNEWMEKNKGRIN